MRKIFIVLTLLFATFCSSMAEVWEGDGTQTAPYLIRTTTDLEKLSQKVNAGIDYRGVFFRLENDLDLTTVCGDSVGDWTSIGTIDAYFEGNFNGNKHTISHLYIQTRGTSYKGLFGYVGPHGKIYDLSVEGTVYATFWCGMVAGANSGSIANCINKGGNVDAHQFAGGIVGGNFGTVFQCENKSEVHSDLSTGGICGYNYGKLYNCHNQGEIYGYNGVGGITGYNGGFSSFTNCYNSPIGIVQNCDNLTYTAGHVKVGGITGRNDGLLFNDYNQGKVNGRLETGGLVGFNGGFDGVDGFLYNSYNTGHITCSISQGGGVVGVNNSYGDIYNVYHSGNMTTMQESGGLVALNEGNVSHSYLIGDTCIMVGNNKGFATDLSIFAKDNLLELANQLNEWVNTSKDSTFSHWKSPNATTTPYFSDLAPLYHNVLVYNFHGIIQEDLLAFAEGSEVVLTIVSDSNYTISGVEAFIGTEPLDVTIEGLQIKFIMPSDDVTLNVIYDENTPDVAEYIANEKKLEIRAGKGEVLLKANDDTNIQIHTINGQAIRRFSMTSGENRNIKLPTGVYLINGTETLVW